MNVRDVVLDRIDRSGNQTFLIDGNSGRQLTYTEFHRLACALAADLSARGIHRGDRVAVMFPNCCELAILYFAVMYVGATIVPINPNLSENDIRLIVSSCDPKLVVASASCTEKVKAVANSCATLWTSQDVTSRDQTDAILLESLAVPAEFVPLSGVTADDFLVIMYTSGTTAKPKGLVHRIGRMFRNATAFADMQRIDGDARFYLTLSMAYMGGFYNLLILPFLRGATVVVDNVFDARSSLNFWEKIGRHEVNTLWFAPTVMSILMKMDRGRTGEEYCRQFIRHVLVGFAPLPLKLKQDFEQRYGVHLIENYGLSETLFVSARSTGTNNPGYVGEAVPGIQLRVAHDDGTTLPANKEGELQVLTPDLMAGYLGDGGSLMELNAAEWFSTGDLARLDDHGSLSITGRKKDMIIRGGVNISPAAVEDVLQHAPGVADVAVVSVPHELYGEDVVAVLKLEAGVQLESILASVMAHATRELASHQQPARYIAIDDFPRTANGKVQKSRLRELVFEKLQIGSESLLRSRPAPQRAAG